MDGTSHTSEGEVQDGQNSFDSQSNANSNTPKSKALKAQRENSSENNPASSAMGA